MTEFIDVARGPWHLNVRLQVLTRSQQLAVLGQLMGEITAGGAGRAGRPMKVAPDLLARQSACPDCLAASVIES